MCDVMITFTIEPNDVYLTFIVPNLHSSLPGKQIEERKSQICITNVNPEKKLH